MPIKESSVAEPSNFSVAPAPDFFSALAPGKKSRLQKTDLYSKHKKNLNFNIKSFNKPRIFPKNGKPYKNWIYSVSKNVFSFILN